jgi:hypothetical protein
MTEREVHMRRCIALAAASITACSGGLTGYQKAAMQFGSSASAGATAARDVAGVAGEACRMTAPLHAAHARSWPDGARSARDPGLLPTKVRRAGGEVSFTWRDRCARLAEYDKAIVGALLVLDAYASALKAAATRDRAAVETDLTAAKVTDAVELAQELRSSALIRARELSEPMWALARISQDLVRRREIEPAVRRAERPVKTILLGVEEYLATAKEYVVDGQRSAHRPAEGGGAAPDVDLAKLQVLDERIGATAGLARELDEAHAHLVEGAEARVPEDQVREFVSKKAEAIVRQVNVLRKLSARG